jgi:hypothetical protein
VARAGDAFVLAPGEGRSIDLGLFAMTVKATSDETDGIFSLLEADERRGSARRSISTMTPPRPSTSSRAST